MKKDTWGRDMLDLLFRMRGEMEQNVIAARAAWGGAQRAERRRRDAKFRQQRISRRINRRRK